MKCGALLTLYTKSGNFLVLATCAPPELVLGLLREYQHTEGVFVKIWLDIELNYPMKNGKKRKGKVNVYGELEIPNENLYAARKLTLYLPSESTSRFQMIILPLDNLTGTLGSFQRPTDEERVQRMDLGVTLTFDHEEGCKVHRGFVTDPRFDVSSPSPMSPYPGWKK